MKRKKILNQILHVADDISLHEDSCLSFISQKNSIFITKAENDINKEKRQMLVIDRINSLKFIKRKKFQKTVFERRTCKVH